MKWIYWTIVVIIILGFLDEVSATHRRRRNRDLSNRNKNAIKRRAFLKRKHLEELYADNANEDMDDEDDYYDAFHLGRNVPDKKIEIKEVELQTNTGTQPTAAAADLGADKDAIEGADSERLIGTGNNAVFSSFLTKKQNILNQWTTSTTTVAPTVTTTSTQTIDGPVTLLPTTAVPAPAPAPAPMADATGGQRIAGAGNRQVLVQYRPLVIRKTNRRRPANGNHRRPVVLQNIGGGLGGGLGGGNVIRVPVRVQGG